MTTAPGANRAPVVLELPTDDTPIHIAAEMYARVGLYPIRIYGLANGRCSCREGAACPAPGKHPVGNEWQKNLTHDLDTVRDVFRGHRGNIGLALGGEFVLIDADGAEGMATAAELAIPDTLRSVSGSGQGGHWVFKLAKYQDGKAITDRRVGAGLDVKVRGQLVAAPSLHRSGNRYRWVSTVEPAVLPDWLFERIKKPAVTRPTVHTPAVGQRGDMFKRVRAFVAKMPHAVSGEQGSIAAYNAANVIVSNGLTSGEEWEIACEYNARCVPPWSEPDLRHKLESARTAANPHVLPDRPAPGRPDFAVVNGGRDDSGGGGGGSGGSGGGSGGGGQGSVDNSWKDELHPEHTRQGPRLAKTAANVALILQLCPLWAGRLRKDTFTETAVVRDAPWSSHMRRTAVDEWQRWEDTDFDRLQDWIAREFSVVIDTKVVKRGVALAAERDSFSSAQDWLTGLAWDGVRRLDSWLTTYMGATPTPYTALVGRLWLISAAARVMQPGCQVDYALILEGPQRAGKSQALRALAVRPRWFNNSKIDMASRDGAMALRGVLITELAELSSMRATDVDTVKQFITCQVDKYRAFGREDRVEGPRHGVFAGTVNGAEYLNDPTGGDRFWPVRVAAVHPVDLDSLRKDAEQLWAEALAEYRAGARWWPQGDAEKALAHLEQDERRAEDPWQPAVEKFLSETTTHPTTPDILLALGVDLDKRDPRNARRVVGIMTALGYEKRRLRGTGCDDRRRVWVKK